MRILGLDPGTTQSALVVLGDQRVLFHFIEENAAILQRVAYFASIQHPTSGPPLNDVLVIEQIHSMGMAVGQEVFESVWWAGRFAQAWEDYSAPELGAGLKAERVKRHAVKMHLCGNMRAKDSNIRQALIDRFGGQSAIGKKGSQGPLYGLKSHEFPALAVALTWKDLFAQKPVGRAGEATEAHV